MSIRRWKKEEAGSIFVLLPNYIYGILLQLLIRFPGSARTIVLFSLFVCVSDKSETQDDTGSNRVDIRTSVQMF